MNDAGTRHPLNRPSPVHLVGAGPGDPDLLTVKALRLIQNADVVVYDRLVSESVLALIPVGTSRIFVGKESGRHTMVQDEINALLVKLAQSGRTVVRLKGGDPLTFGRGSEEAAWLERHGIPVDVVPGITAAAGCAAASGIPLTHRGLATGVRYVTGHCRKDRPLDMNWESLADPDTTLVVYMGLANLQEISERLIAAGLPQETPAMAIAEGTTNRQKSCLATLATLPAEVEAAALSAPALFIIGRVVSLAQKRSEASWHNLYAEAD